jgi:hypothetical protein
MNRIFFVLLIALSMWTFSGHAPQVRRCCDGETWLSMDAAQKRGLVTGFIYGVQRGHRDGCTDYDAIARIEFHVNSPEEIPIARCMKRELQFEKNFDYYENRITSFYDKNQKDRDIPFSVMFEKISDGENLSDEKIHEWRVAQP